MHKGGECNIICTQPRRISAIGLADRVAKERGQAVGATVRFLPLLFSLKDACQIWPDAEWHFKVFCQLSPLVLSWRNKQIVSSEAYLNMCDFSLLRLVTQFA